MKKKVIIFALAVLILGCKKQNQLKFANIGGTRYWHGWENDIYFNLNTGLDSEVLYNVYDTFSIKIINDSQIHIDGIHLGAAGRRPEIHLLVRYPAYDSINKVAFHGIGYRNNYEMTLWYNSVKNSIHIDYSEGFLGSSPVLDFDLFTP